MNSSVMIIYTSWIYKQRFVRLEQKLRFILYDLILVENVKKHRQDAMRRMGLYCEQRYLQR